jgi:dihydroxycyclohexadiene carboxylate dehydrogenase
MTENSQQRICPGRFEGRVAIVTGGGQGIGLAAARRLGREGARLLVADLSPESGIPAVEALKAEGVEAVFAPADLGRYAGACSMVEAAMAAFGAVHVLVNNVGGTIWKKPFWYYTEEEIRLEVERSFWPPLWCSRAVIPALRRSGGAIVNVGAHATDGVYRVTDSASKGGVAALTAALAQELADLGIRVNCVEPGATDVGERRVQRNPRPLSSQEREWEEHFQKLIGQEDLMGRFASVEEQAAVIAFLASDDSAHLTGEILRTGRRGSGLQRVLGFIP